MCCFQCQQTANWESCTLQGLDDKRLKKAALQNLLVYAVNGLSLVVIEGRKVGVNDQEVDVFTAEIMFSILTKVDFDLKYLVRTIGRSVILRERLKEKVKSAGGKVDFTEPAANFIPESTLEGLLEQGETVGGSLAPQFDPGVLSLREFWLQQVLFLVQNSEMN